MASIAQSIPGPSSRSAWFWEFLKEELAPYPGRGILVVRMLVATTIAMILTMTFRLPYGAYAAAFALTISRENPRATLNAVKVIVVGFGASVLYVLLGTMLFLQDPTLRLIWVIATLFVMFYALSAMSNYTAAARFGYLLIITIPLWDEHSPATVRVEYTLWAMGTIALGSLATAVTEVVFAELKPHDSLVEAIAQCFTATVELLDSYAATGHGEEQEEKQVAQLALVGTSSMRRDLARSGYSPLYAEQMGAVVLLAGRLVDIAANLKHLALNISHDDRERMRLLSENIAGIREDLLGGRIPHLIHQNTPVSRGAPLLAEMERAVALISDAFAGATSLTAFAEPNSTGGDPGRGIFARDAFSNPEHIKFALKGCLAAGLCYLIYNGKDWPGISTSITTCFLTALTTVGSSHQKQILRLTGAFVGGVVLGIGAQMFVLPYVDSIFGFTLLFLAVTIPAAWISISGPRLSYFGVQIAVAFYLINLSEFKVQTSLYLARDRVIGIFLGLLMMWLVFDRLWGVPAVIEMRRTFVANLRLLAQFAREPLSKTQLTAVKQGHSLRETINNNFEKVRASADGVALEFGPSRDADLVWRGRIRQWQPQLRTLFLLRIALWKYRVQLPGFELPEPVLLALQEADNQSAGVLAAIADRMEGKPSGQPVDLQGALDRLEDAIQNSTPEHGQEVSQQLQTLLLLARRTKDVVISLREIEPPA